MTATTPDREDEQAQRRRILELKLWMGERNITIMATARYLHWSFSTTRYNLMRGSEPKRRAALLKLGFPEELLPPVSRLRGEPRFPGLENQDGQSPAGKVLDMPPA